MNQVNANEQKNKVKFDDNDTSFGCETSMC